MDKPIFIVGMPRTGSTLWLNIIASHYDVCRIGELLFLTPWKKDFRYFYNKYIKHSIAHNEEEKLVDLMFSRKWLPGITSSYWFYDIEKLDTPAFRRKILHRIFESNKTLEDFFKIIIEETSIYYKKNRCCAKFPVYVNYIPTLLRWYPSCKIVHVTRDPCAIVVSKTNDMGGTKAKIKNSKCPQAIVKNRAKLFVVAQYIWTSRIHMLYRDLDNYSIYHYEDLLVDPENTIKKLCNFIEIRFCESMLNPKSGQVSSITEKKQNGFDRDAAFRWKNIISSKEEKLIKKITKNSMDRFEYNPDKYINLMK